MADPLAGWQKLGPGDLVASGLAKPGPLAGWVKSSDPAQNAQAIREGINPSPQAQSPVLGQPGPAQSPTGNIFQRYNESVRQKLASGGELGAPGWMKGLQRSLAAPGTGPLGSAVGQAVASGAGALTGGKGLAESAKEAGKSAAGAGLMSGAVAGGARLASPAVKAAFEGRTGRKLAAMLQERVPAWKGLPKNAKGLYEMAHGEGENLLDATFKGAKGLIPAGHTTEVPVEIAAAAKIKGMQTPVAASGRGMEPATVKVATRDLVDNLPTLRAKGRGMASEAWSAIDRSLEGVPNKALQDARSQYRNGMGWVTFAEKGGFLKGEKYDAAKAMAALDKHGKELLGRGMQDVRGTVRGPLANPITTGNLGRAGTAIGGGLGLLAGHGMGLPGEAGGAIGGGYLGHMLGRQVPSYGNVPPGTFLEFLKRLGPRVGGAAPSMVST